MVGEGDEEVIFAVVLEHFGCPDCFDFFGVG